LKYIKTKNGEELIARTVIIPEEIEMERIKKRQIQISMSDKPGNYNDDDLGNLLAKYLSEDRTTPQRIKKIILPLCLKHTVVTREIIKKELINKGEAVDEGKAGTILTSISREIGIEARDYLRQIIQYDKPYDKPNPWEKENYRLPERYKELVRNTLSKLDKQEERGK
jgi:hypothetical protein